MLNRHVLLKSWVYVVLGDVKDSNILKEFEKDMNLVKIDLKKELDLLKGGKNG